MSGGGDFVAYGVGYFGVDGEGGGEIACGGFGVALVFGEDVADYVGSFEADGELSAGAVVPGAGEEWAVGFEHRGCGEVEGALRVRAVGGDVLDEFGGAGDGLPVDAGVVGDDGAGVEVRRGWRERARGGAWLWDRRCRGAWRGRCWRLTFSFTASCVEFAEEGEGLVFGEAGGEFGEGLGGEADGFDFVALAI